MTLLAVDDYPRLDSPTGPGTVRLDRGELLWIRGDSGSGKTRFLRRLIDLDPEPLGRIRVDGADIATIPCQVLRRRLAYMPQDPVRFPGTGRELLERVPALRANIGRTASPAEVEAWIDALDVRALLDRPIAEYSGGENRRLALICVLQLRPDALLLDEPTTGLDELRARAVVRMVEASRREGTAVLWVTHDATRDREGTTLWIGGEA